MCNIFIDEVKTPSYHRSGLESLGMGIVTICSLSDDVEKVLLTASGADKSPFVNVNHLQLENKLTELINSGLPKLLEMGYNNRLWMEKNWNPRIIAEEYIKIYKTI